MAKPGIPNDLSYIAKLSYGKHSSNMLIQGENLQVLRALQDSHTGRIRCVYIDPPYNNQEKYRHYRDTNTKSHDDWLEMMTERLQAIKPLLATDGSLWISIDDREVHYLKVAADKIFGRKNFITTIIWQQRTTRESRKVFSNNHEYLLVYAIDRRKFKAGRNLLPGGPALFSKYKNPDSDPRGPWRPVPASAPGGHATAAQFYEITAPNGKVHSPSKGRCWTYTKKKMQKEIARGNIWFGRTGNNVPTIKTVCKAQYNGTSA